MSKLVWGLLEERFFETGVDRGVLYVGDEIGVPWNGLVSVKESPTGGGPQPFYLDGVKYLNLSESEEFEASIQAFGYPASFTQCLGDLPIHNGLYITQQPKKNFNFTYRSRLGNAILGAEYSYKIHMVWNALAGPVDKENNTIAESPNPFVFNLPVSTLAPLTPGYHPSAHMVVDASLTPSDILEELESLLYGSDEGDAHFPTQSELIELFS